MKSKFTIGAHRVGIDCVPYVIAEMSGNHNQSLTRALEIVNAAAAAGAPADATTAAPGVAPALVLRPMRPREVLFVLRSACGGDVRALCGDVPPGGGRIIQCLAAQAPSLSPACADVLGQFAAQ